MGLFSESRRVYVGTTIGRLVADEMLSDLSRTSPIKAVLAEDDIADVLIDDIMAGVGIKARNAFNYANSGNYALGLPSVILESTESSISSDFMPFVVFRENKTRVVSNDTKYDSSVELCRRLGVDFEDLNESIHENPDINDLDQALLMFAIAVDEEHELGQKYVFDFFFWLAVRELVHNNVVFQVNSDGDEIINNAVTFEDASFKMQLNYSGIVAEEVTGRPNKVSGEPLETGGYMRKVSSQTVTYNYDYVY